jgi:subtilisin family serine protease
MLAVTRSRRPAALAAAALLLMLAALLLVASSPSRSVATVTGTTRALPAKKAAKAKARHARRLRAPVLRHTQARAVRATAKKQPAARPTPPGDPLVADSWALQAIHATAAWARTTGSPDVVVAVLDTGVDATQPDLAGALVPGVDLVSDDAEPQDDHGHGTQVAGIVAARAGNGIGAAGICGRCSVMPVKVIAADGTGTSDDVAAGLRWAVDHGARVVNLSFVLSAPDANVVDAIRYAQEHGVVVVGAAGNDGATSPVFPAAEAGVVSVAATDEGNAPYAWSGRGPWVRVAAPGCAPATVAGGSYANLCGTSAATAVVSGLAALALSARPGVTAAEAVQALEAGAVPVGDTVATGRVDAAATVGLLAPAVAPAPATTPRPQGRPPILEWVS